MPLRFSCSGPMLCLSLVAGGGLPGPRVSRPVPRWCCGRSGVGHSPSPDRPSLGQAAEARCPCSFGRAGCGRWGPSTYAQRTLSRVGVVRLVDGTRAPAGGRPLAGFDASTVGRSPPPSRPSMGQAAGAHRPFSVGAGDVGVGTRHQCHSASFCQLALRATGAARGCPGGGAPLASVWRVQSWALSHTPLSVFGACGRCPLPTGCRTGEGGPAEPSATQQRAL